MDYKLMKLLGWTMLGIGVGLMGVAQSAAEERRESKSAQ